MKAILVWLIGAVIGFVLADTLAPALRARSSAGVTRLSPAERSARWVDRMLRSELRADDNGKPGRIITRAREWVEREPSAS